MPASKIVLAPFPGYSLFDCGTGVRQGSRGNKRHTMKKALQERKRHFRSKTDQRHDLFCDKLFVLSIQEKIDKRIGIIKFLLGPASIGMSCASFCECTAYVILNK
ncbi:hypothetical protein C7R94_16190 [Brevibacillus sp. NRRL NRS-603]|nr:hypothetical protein [Brevibacillus formosus]PSK16850.1 hypothetical protein C7R94_16190 [Brevibacillus sp. NRRL NRS-603]